MANKYIQGEIKRYSCSILIALVIGLFVSILQINPVAAIEDEVKWASVNLPTEGKRGDWVLAKDSDVRYLARAIDNTIYCSVTISGTEHKLFKSTVDDRIWTETGYDGGVITDIVCSSADADTIYVSDDGQVYKSDNAGGSFVQLGHINLGENESISCLDVGYNAANKPFVYIGTVSTEDTFFGSVYCILEGDFGDNWIDLKAGNFNVHSIACAPGFKDNSRLIAAVTDETRTFIINNYGTIVDWTGSVELLKDGVNPFALTAASDIRFPLDFEQEQEMFIGVVGDGGGVYRIGNGYAISLDIDENIISLDLVGETGATLLLAGQADDAEVWYSDNDGRLWNSTCNAPTGDSLTHVIMSPDFRRSGVAFAVTSGIESAFSFSTDGGLTWAQEGLIDTEISAIIDLSPSPNFDQNDTLFMLTWGGWHSLWRSLNGGSRWERILTSLPDDIDCIDMVELSPNFYNSKVIYISGSSKGKPAIWKSADNGQNFGFPRFTHDPDTDATFSIDSWAIINDNTLLVGSYGGLVYYTNDSGLFYSKGQAAGSQTINSIAVSPDYDQDNFVLIGNTDGEIYCSDDSGKSFKPLPEDANLPPFTGEITVAFDPEFCLNNTVYAASSTAATADDNERIFRFKIGSSTNWESIDGTLPEGSIINELKASHDGILYGANSKADGGVERCLNPTYPLGPTFETITRGLESDTVLWGLWLSDNRLWSIDCTNNRLMSYTDCLNVPVILISPPYQALGVGTITDHAITDVSLNWMPLGGATKYKWQLNTDPDFSNAFEGFENDTAVSSSQLPAFEPANTYYWRVRATEPVLSPWSTKWSFTISLGPATVAPLLINPEAGAGGVMPKPIFQWTAIAGADSYELLVSTDIFFSNPIIVKIEDFALHTTAWQCDINLEQETTYYWKVRARGSNNYSAWSAVGAFHTASLPKSQPQVTQPTNPLMPPLTSPKLTPPEATTQFLPPAQPATPDWVTWLMFLGGALLLLVLVLLIMVAILTIRIWKF